MLCMWTLKGNDTNELICGTEKNSQTQKMNLWVPGVDGIVREFGKVMYTLLYLKWVVNKDLLYSAQNSAQCCVAAWMEIGLGEKGHMCMCGQVPSLST